MAIAIISICHFGIHLPFSIRHDSVIPSITTQMQALNRISRTTVPVHRGFFMDADSKLYLRIADELRSRINEMQSGEKLPSVRHLCGEWNVSKSTVISAYSKLVSEGLCYSKPSSGYFAMKPVDMPHSEEIETGINLASGMPGADAFPFTAFKKAVCDVLDYDKEAAFTYQMGYGFEGLREAIANNSIKQGMPAQTENVLITTGAQQALYITSMLLLKPGSVVIMENPSYPGASAVFSAAGARIIGVPVNRNGMDEVHLFRAIKRHRPALVYTMPFLQTPSTACMSQSTMTELVRLSRELGFYILEEDVVNELMNDKRQTLYSMAPDRVIHSKSFSKIIMPGIRTGFMLAEPSITQRLLEVKQRSDFAATGLIQRALSRCLNDESHADHVKMLRSMFDNRRSIALSYLQSMQEYGLTYDIPDGGVDFWLTLPGGLSDETFVHACKQGGILVGAGSKYYVCPHYECERKIRLSVASQGDEALHNGLSSLRDILIALVSKKRGKIIIK